MKPTIEILSGIQKNSKQHKNEVFTKLFRYMLRPDLYYVAYKKLYANNGAGTKGVNDDTADAFSEIKIESIITNLTNESYAPSPARRTYIRKTNGKLRPLGIPTFTDKLVQEVLRMILESVYEPIFLDCSHGFRPRKSCHTALTDAKKQFNGVRWFIEGDIKGCFDNINHAVLVGLISQKIKDARLIKLIYKFLKAGYLEDWKYNNTYSGTPQGGIISPILSNIYLHELDKFVEKVATNFYKPNDTIYTYEYGVTRRVCEKLRKQVSEATKEERPMLLKQLKEARKIQLSTPAKSQTDKKLKYIRYADDFLIGISGSKEDCEHIKNELTAFISNTLKMELSDEKTLITHSQTKARFLGYDIRVRRNNQIKPNGQGYTRRTLSNKTELLIPFKDKIEKFLWNEKVIEQNSNGFMPIKRNGLIRLTELEIVSAYNSELRGICNFYSLASDYCNLNYFACLMEYSCLKTLAAKRKSSISKIKKMYSDKKGSWCIPYETKQGEKQMYIAKYQDCKNSANGNDIKNDTLIKHFGSTTTFESRLKAKVCELCGTEEAEHYEIHHVNKVKNLNGKEPWEIMMIAKRRKTMVVCINCHDVIHGS